MKSKTQKRKEAKKNAEALKAKKKALRTAKGNAASQMGQKGKKGRSSVGQSKKKK